MGDLRADLQEMVDAAEWGWLKIHATKGRLIMVTPGLNLVDVGLALAEDNVTAVRQWLDDGLIHQPTEEQITHWDQNEAQSFESLIIQPFVLAKEPLAC